MPDYSLEGVERPANVRERKLSNYMKDRSGSTYGRLNVIALYGTHIDFNRTYWICRCDCGNITIVDGGKLTSGKTQSCGCLWHERISTHQMSDTPEHIAWRGMKQRCYNPNNTKYALYGGRGIEVCERWRDSFEAFYDDLGPRPSSTHSIDRINPDGNYEPANTRWATIEQQNDNLRTTRKITFDGKTHSLGWWARETDIGYKTLQRRFEMGWSREKALTEPVDESYAHNRK